MIPNSSLKRTTPRPEDGAPLGQLALGVLNVLEGRDDQNRILVQAGAEPAEHLPRLRRVRGTGYELERH